MKNTIINLCQRLIVNIARIACIMMLTMSGFLSCVSIPKSVIKDAFPRVDTRPPVDAFGLVMTEHTILPKACEGDVSIETCDNIMKSLPPIKQGGVGSGLLVKGKTKTVFLTAAHVCESETPDFYETNGIKITLSSSMELSVRISTGEILPAKVAKIDHTSDLCALSVKPYTEPVIWSRMAPKVGDKVYAISAPHGINGPKMSLIFSGFYSGKIGEIHHYTIPTRPGSSGSIVLNENFVGIGMLNAAYISMESIGIGTGHEKILSFLESL